MGFHCWYRYSSLCCSLLWT